MEKVFTIFRGCAVIKKISSRLARQISRLFGADRLAPSVASIGPPDIPFEETIGSAEINFSWKIRCTYPTKKVKYKLVF